MDNYGYGNPYANIQRDYADGILSEDEYNNYMDKYNETRLEERLEERE